MKYCRQPFNVEAIQVTKENMEEVASWCEGTIVLPNPDSHDPESMKYIQVDVHSPADVRQTRAFVNDFVLKLENGGSFKVYTQKAFVKNFVPREGETRVVTKPEEPAKKDSPKSTKAKTPSRDSLTSGIRPEQREALEKVFPTSEAPNRDVETKVAEVQFSEAPKNPEINEETGVKRKFIQN